MGRIRISMGWIAILGVDLAVIRHLVRSQNEVVLHLALIVPVLQAGLWFLVRGSPRFRGFWLGLDAIAAAWIILLLVHGIDTLYPLDDSWMLDFYRWGINAVGTPFNAFLIPYANNFAVLAPAMAGCFFIPQVATAIAGGILTQGLLRLSTVLIAKRRANPINPQLEPRSSNPRGVSS